MTESSIESSTTSHPHRIESSSVGSRNKDFMMGVYHPRQHCTTSSSRPTKPRQVKRIGEGNIIIAAPTNATTTTTTTTTGSGDDGDDMQQWMYKAKRHLGKSAQSVLKSLAASLLIVSLFNFWNWLASRLNVGLNKSKSTTTFCANSQSLSETRENKLQENLPVPQESTMTIEVSEIMSAIVNPEDLVEDTASSSDQEDSIVRMKNHLSASAALPVLRLNSESFDDHFSSEGDLFLEEEDDASSSSSSENCSSGILTGRRDQDSCSDYCSGSGSLSGSPIPDHHHHHHEIDSDVVTSQLIRRDSDTSDSSVNEDDERKSCGGEVAPELKGKIISQVETMFSDEHLEKDGFLLKHVRRRSDGFVSLKLVAGLRKVKQLSREFSTVLVALKESDKLEVNAEGTKIRRKEPLTSLLKSLPIKQAKKEKSQTEKDNQSSSNGNNSSADEQNISIIRASNQTNKENVKGAIRNNNQRNGASPTAYGFGVNGNSNRKNSSQQQQCPNAKGPASRKNSNVSTASSNGSNSRNGSFSSGTGRPHPADLFRHVMNSSSTGSSGEDSPQVIRRRGGSLPINTGHRGSIGGHNLSPNSSPPSNVPAGFLRPKSNSYCEGTNQQTSGMSPWLLKRKASAVSRSSNGDIVISGVTRQPRGPDGTKGFASGYRELILQERLLTSVSECSTFSA